MALWKGSQAEFWLLLVSESSDSSLSDTEVAQGAHDIEDEDNLPVSKPSPIRFSRGLVARKPESRPFHLSIKMAKKATSMAIGCIQ